MQNKKKILVMVAFLTIAVGTAIASLRHQQPSNNQIGKAEIQGNKRIEKLDAELPVVDSTAPEPSSSSERRKREAKGQRYNMGQPYVGPETTVTAHVKHWPADFSAIPVSQSDAIVIASISNARAYLSNDKSAVYSEFSGTVESVLKGGANGIAKGSSIVTEREGGRVRFPSGFISRFYVVGFGTPQVGRRYLLFLKRIGDECDLRILTGYELRDGRVFPLDESLGVVHFEKYEGSDETTFLNTIMAAIDDATASVK